MYMNCNYYILKDFTIVSKEYSHSLDSFFG